LLKQQLLYQLIDFDKIISFDQRKYEESNFENVMKNQTELKRIF